MTTEEIHQLLEKLTETRAQLDLLRMDMQSPRAQILAPVQKELDALDIEYGPKLETAQNTEAVLVEQIKAAVLELGQSVKSDHLNAVYSEGRKSWDDRALTGYAMAHPELFAFRKVGEPSVSLRVK